MSNNSNDELKKFSKETLIEAILSVFWFDEYKIKLIDKCYDVEIKKVFKDMDQHLKEDDISTKELTFSEIVERQKRYDSLLRKQEKLMKLRFCKDKEQ